MLTRRLAHAKLLQLVRDVAEAECTKTSATWMGGDGETWTYPDQKKLETLQKQAKELISEIDACPQLKS